jgi:hypothetical protein
MKYIVFILTLALLIVGNENMHALTRNGRSYRLRIDLMTYDNKASYAEYSSFWVGQESDKYRLHVSGYSGTAGQGIINDSIHPITCIDPISHHNDIRTSHAKAQNHW